jgi:tetratricopeptide (TPR) repeat protein
LDWSFESLDDVTQAVLRRVSVFADDFSLDAATVAVASGVVDAQDVRLALHELVSKSLLTHVRTGDGSRFKLLHTIRTYASGHCPKPERSAALGRVADHYAAVLGPKRSLDRRWLSSMAAELDNLLAVMSAEGLELPVQQKLMWSVGYYRDLTDQFAIGLAELDRHFATLEAPSQEQVGLLTLAADLAIRVGDLDMARSYCAQADEVASGFGCPDWDDAGLLRTQAALALWGGDARLCVGTAELGLNAGLSKRGTARLHDVRGIALVQLGDIENAVDDFLAELRLWTDLESDTKSCTTHGNLAEVYFQLGNHREAAKHQLECLELAREFGQTVWIAHSMVMGAHLTAATDDWPMALRLQRAADLEINRIGLKMFDSDIEAREELLTRAADHLGTEAVEAPFVNLGDPDREAIYELAALIFRTTLEGADQVI